MPLIDNKRGFKKEDLIEILECDVGEHFKYDDVHLVKLKDKIVTRGRWILTHLLIFKDESDDTYWSTHYNVGATEYQETYPFEDYGWLDLVPCIRMIPVTKTIVDYEEAR